MRRGGARPHPAKLAALVLALLVQAFAPDWAALVMRAVPAAVQPELCLAGGHPAEPPPQDQDGKHRHDALCPVCQAFGVVQTALGCAPPSLPGPRALGRRAGREPVRTAPRRRSILRPRARAPPPVV